MVNMDSNPRQQILQQLKKAGSIAIVLPEQISADALASGLAEAVATGLGLQDGGRRHSPTNTTI